MFFLFPSTGVVAMHIETLEAVHKESKRLPPIQKVGYIPFSLIISQTDKHIIFCIINFEEYKDLVSRSRNIIAM